MKKPKIVIEEFGAMGPDGLEMKIVKDGNIIATFLFQKEEEGEIITDLIDALATLVERIEYYASLAEDEAPNIEQWAYTDNSGDIKKAKEALKKAGCTDE